MRILTPNQREHHNRHCREYTQETEKVYDKELCKWRKRCEQVEAINNLRKKCKDPSLRIPDPMPSMPKRRTNPLMV